MSPKHTLIGKAAPVISLPNADGTAYELKPGAQGTPTAVFFYPQADTYGCTREVCSFRDALTEKVEFKESGITVVGIAPNSVAAVKAFATKHNVTYPMLSDQSGEGRKAYSVPRSLMGLAPGRITFFIDSQGVVREVYDSLLDFNGHVKAVSQALERYKDAGKPGDTAAAASESAPTQGA